MKDKQIIIGGDKFEKAENESINQEAVNKFIEDTDKFYPKNSKIMYDYNAKDCEQCSSDSVCCYCKNIACYKLEEQLKQKEQECKELNEYSVGFARKCQKLELDVCHLKDKNYNLQRQLDQLKAESEEIKEFQKLLEEQMKFNKSELELSLSSEIKRSEFLLKEFKKVDKQRDNWREQAEKLKQTLAEIKEIAENAKTKVLVDMEEFWEQILQKISEVENETNIYSKWH